MEKTLEEIAFEKYPYHSETPIRMRNGEMEKEYHAYLNGASEQQLRDLENGWDWILEACSKHPITRDELPILYQSYRHKILG